MNVSGGPPGAAGHASASTRAPSPAASSSGRPPQRAANSARRTGMEAPSGRMKRRLSTSTTGNSFLWKAAAVSHNRATNTTPRRSLPRPAPRPTPPAGKSHKITPLPDNRPAAPHRLPKGRQRLPCAASTASYPSSGKRSGPRCAKQNPVRPAHRRQLPASRSRTAALPNSSSRTSRFPPVERVLAERISEQGDHIFFAVGEPPGDHRPAVRGNFGADPVGMEHHFAVGGRGK